MILYFSGTGNSEYVAKRISEQLQDGCINLFTKIKSQDTSDLYSSTPWIIVTPTYAWRIPRIVNSWLKSTSLTGHQKIYFVMTCGGNISNAEKYLKALCRDKHLEFMGCYPIIMPENYIAMFPTPDKTEAKNIINKAEETIDSLIPQIQAEQIIPQSALTLHDRLNSSIVNDIFYPLFVHANKFHVTNNCISCGQCVKVCPLQNIQLIQGTPVWKDNCTHCMSCISRCPKEAIEYGKQSKGRPRYTCTKL